MTDCEDMVNIRQILTSGSRCCLEDFQTLLQIKPLKRRPIVNFILLVNKSELGSAIKNLYFLTFFVACFIISINVIELT